MDQKKKKFLLPRLEKYLARLQDDVDRAQKALQYCAGEALGSWSIAGERKHAETDLRLALDLLEKTRGLCRKIASCPQTKAARIVPPCYVIVEFNGDRREENGFYFLETNLQIPGTRIVSPSSPLGKAVSNKKPGSRFSYKTADGQKNSISGIIRNVE